MIMTVYVHNVSGDPIEGAHVYGKISYSVFWIPQAPISFDTNTGPDGNAHIDLGNGVWANGGDVDLTVEATGYKTYHDSIHVPQFAPDPHEDVVLFTTSGEGSTPQTQPHIITIFKNFGAFVQKNWLLIIVLAGAFVFLLIYALTRGKSIKK